MVLNPRESAKFIADCAKHVQICHESIAKLGTVLVDKIHANEIKTENFSQNDIHPKSTDPWAIDWLFVVDTLNFCFWHVEGQNGWRVEGQTGYFALCVAINRAMKNQIDILNPKYYSIITEEQLGKILKSDNEVPISLLSERVKCLHEVGSLLLENFDGSFQNVIKNANSSSSRLLDLIVNNFKCFKDEAAYNGKDVSFYKRAQILIGDIWACFNKQGLGYFEDIEQITMFADYRVPQVLVYFGVFKYSEDLLNRLKKNEILPNGNEAEVEIRGCSVHAVELLREFVLGKCPGSKINSILIDHFLWDYRRKNNAAIVEKHIPFHKTYCIYY